ncbi:response regulator [Leptolyngbyaceae cyanobacterium CCMR0082]|uniref:Response regulator n=2 Tax=Adonisia turfae TaxID=2950184 RepID=A0A6M0SCX5_9CYAN|nr:response regulator [Adonisia turfae]MDV3352655.1 response regulator [Leptothoe sp. LEGE 181152]NEZ58446.1 response regulator [Adonisia turfae CCMR0081]NEZ65821.1 response regulator [Adonisia turfae CCMR0082]
MVLAGTITQKTLHPLTLLAQLVGRQVSGELLVVSNDVRWSLWLQRGKLLFATSSQNGFDALRFEGRQLFPDAISDLVLAQLQLYHRQYTHQGNDLTADYRAIRWLVEQEHITFDQAGQFIRALAVTTVTSLLRVSRGSYEVNNFSNIVDYPAFCTLDIRTLVEQCHQEAETFSSKRNTPPPVKQQEVVMPEPGNVIDQLVQPKSDIDTLLNQASSSSTFGSSLQVLSPDTFNPAQMVAGGGSPSYQLVCIDSDSQSLRELREFLEDTVFSITSVDDVATAVADLAKCQPDLIMLTTAMEGLDGFDLCSHLRRHPQYKDVPIILMARKANLIGRIRAKLCGASFYISKPINRTKLMVKLFTLLV